MALKPIQARNQRPYSRRQFLATLGKGAVAVTGAATATAAFGGSGASLSPRYGHALAYYSALGQVILFGGARGTDLLTDTWGWTGSKWKKLTRDNTPGPILLPGLAMMDNPDAATVLMVGTGALSQEFETWEFDGFQWTKRESTSTGLVVPEPRFSYALAHDDFDRVGLLFGGGDLNQEGPAYDTWTWSGSDGDWVFDPTSTGPSVRTGHAMAYSTGFQNVVLFGGEDATGNKLGDTWTWEWTVPHWHTDPIASPNPPRRSGHVMASWREGSDPINAYLGSAILFGGCDATGTIKQDTWYWTGASWLRIDRAVNPPPRFRAGMAYDVVRDVLVLFGGLDENGRELGDTWIFTGSDWLSA